MIGVGSAAVAAAEVEVEVDQEPEQQWMGPDINLREGVVEQHEPWRVRRRSRTEEANGGRDGQLEEVAGADEGGGPATLCAEPHCRFRREASPAFR